MWTTNPRFWFKRHTHTELSFVIIQERTSLVLITTEQSLQLSTCSLDYRTVTYALNLFSELQNSHFIFILRLRHQEDQLNFYFFYTRRFYFFYYITTFNCKGLALQSTSTSSTLGELYFFYYITTFNCKGLALLRQNILKSNNRLWHLYQT